MRLAFAAFFVALIAIPVLQVASDARADTGRLYIWNGHLHIWNEHLHPSMVTLSKHPKPKAPEYLQVPRLSRKKTS